MAFSHGGQGGARVIAGVTPPRVLQEVDQAWPRAVGKKRRFGKFGRARKAWLGGSVIHLRLVKKSGNPDRKIIKVTWSSLSKFLSWIGMMVTTSDRFVWTTMGRST